MKHLFMLSMIILTVTSCKTKSSNPFDGKYQVTKGESSIQFEIRDGNFSINGNNLSFIHGGVDRATFKISDGTNIAYVLLKLSNNQLFASKVFETPEKAEASGNPTDLFAKRI